MFRSGNPTLRADTFTAVSVSAQETMTLGGAVNKTAFSLFILVAAAAFAWTRGMDNPALPLMAAGGAIGGLVVALVTAFKKTWAHVTTPLYALLEGLFVGAVSLMYESQFPGIVMNAVGLTVGTLVALLIAYRSGLIRPTENFKLGVVAATGGIFLLYLVSMVLSFFGKSVPFIHTSGWIGIGFSVVVVVIAALNLVLDFDFIESGAGRAPKYMEWYAAFGLLVTLVWLYIEILRLLAKLASRRR